MPKKSKPKFRSKFEESVARDLTKRKVPFSFEALKLKYTVPTTPRTYIVDFLVGRNGLLVVETKGRLTAADRKKMILVRDQNPEYTFAFVFQRAANKLYKGSPTSYGDWAAKNGFMWAEGSVPKEWLV